MSGGSRGGTPPTYYWTMVEGGSRGGTAPHPPHPPLGWSDDGPPLGCGWVEGGGRAWKAPCCSSGGSVRTTHQVRPVELERVQRTLRGRVDVTLSEDLGPPMTVPHSVLLGVVLRGLQNWRLSLVGTPMLMPPLQWQERGGPEVPVICLLGCGQESAGLDLLPQEHRWKWLVVLLP